MYKPNLRVSSLLGVCSRAVDPCCLQNPLSASSIFKFPHSWYVVVELEGAASATASAPCRWIGCGGQKRCRLPSRMTRIINNPSASFQQIREVDEEVGHTVAHISKLVSQPPYHDDTQ